MKLNPAEYASLKGAKLYKWQKEALVAFGKGWPTSLVTCNGAGKTAEVAARAAEWFFAKHPQGKMVATSGSFNQLKNQLWPSLKAKLPKSFKINNGSSPCSVKTPQGGFAVGFSTSEAGRAEGWHPTIGPDVDPVFILIDEGKTVPRAIYEAFDRCTVAYFLVISSPGPPSGRFFDTHHSIKRHYYTIKATSEMCPHIDPEKRLRDADVLGEDSPVYRSMHLAEFTDLDNHVILTQTDLTLALQSPPERNTIGEAVAFFDFAAGGDENTFTLRRGNTVTLVDAWRDTNTVQAVRRFIQKAKELGLQASQCWGDGDGLGLAMISQFWDEEFRINSFRGGMPSDKLDTNGDILYSNLISEVWITGARMIRKGLVHFENLDSESQRQLTDRFLQWDDKGRLRGEKKKDMAVRGVKSPDRADGIMGCLICGSHMAGAISAEAAEDMETGDSEFKSGGITF